MARGSPKRDIKLIGNLRDCQRHAIGQQVDDFQPIDIGQGFENLRPAFHKFIISQHTATVQFGRIVHRVGRAKDGRGIRGIKRINFLNNYENKKAVLASKFKTQAIKCKFF